MNSGLSLPLTMIDSLGLKKCNPAFYNIPPSDVLLGSLSTFSRSHSSRVGFSVVFPTLSDLRCPEK